MSPDEMSDKEIEAALTQLRREVEADRHATLWKWRIEGFEKILHERELAHAA
jgi:hypothetical protein